jgi:hypothetical protein
MPHITERTFIRDTSFFELVIKNLNLNIMTERERLSYEPSYIIGITFPHLPESLRHLEGEHRFTMENLTINSLPPTLIHLY